jgi:hypothetical protein
MPEGFFMIVAYLGGFLMGRRWPRVPNDPWNIERTHVITNDFGGSANDNLAA